MGVFDAGRQMLREMYAMDMNGVTVSYLRDNAVLLKNIPAKIGSWYMYRKTAEFNVRSHNASFRIMAKDMAGVTPELRDVIIYKQRQYLVVKGEGDSTWSWSSERDHDEIIIYAKYSGPEKVQDAPAGDA
ncbi:MAG: hypothetical protein GX945_07880 [Lentisphaerae bacterium]|jgi:hypothetical protein|nr:hypothetical protein [Lentisphaerota bacterium]